MAEVIYAGPYTAVSLPDGTVCERGEPVSVDDDVAANLINQGFKPFKAKNEGGNK